MDGDMLTVPQAELIKLALEWQALKSHVQPELCANLSTTFALLRKARQNIYGIETASKQPGIILGFSLNLRQKV